MPFLIHVHSSREVLFSNQEGARFVANAGRFSGALLIVKHLDSARGITAEKGYLEFAAPFCIANGDSYSYKCIFHPTALWPTPDIKVKRRPGHFDCHVTLKAVQDTRDLPDPLLESGEKVRTSTRTGKYNDLTIQLREDGDSVLPVRLTTMNDTGDKEELYYEMPLERLLWRKWAKISADDVLPESEEFVFFKKVGHITSKGHPPGITISPIDLLSSAPPS